MIDNGIYRLTKDVKNPSKTDKRRKYDWELWLSFKSGTLVLVREDMEYDLKQFGIQVVGLVGWAYKSVKRNEQLFEAFCKNLKPVPIDTLELLQLYHKEILYDSCSYKGILEQLLHVQAISLENVRVAICRMNVRNQ